MNIKLPQARHIKVVDQAVPSSGPAPSPQRGLSKVVYKTIQELGGATENQIAKYAPAMIEDGQKMVVNRVRISNVLNSMQYGGYIISKGAYYMIAPVEYFNQRRTWLQENTKKRVVGMKGKKRAPRRRPERHEPEAHRPVIIERESRNEVLEVAVAIGAALVIFAFGVYFGTQI